MALTTYLANKLLDHAIGKTSFTMPAVFVGLYTASPTIAGTQTNEVNTTSYPNYARVSVPGASWNAAGSGADATNAAITFPTCGAGGTSPVVNYLCTFDAATAGNMLEFFPLGVSQTINNTNAPAVSAGSFTRTAA